MPIATGVAITIARLAYYGEILPNTYYAKSLALDDAIPTGARYLWHIFKRQVGGIWPIAGLTILAAVGTGIALCVMLLKGDETDWSRPRRYCIAVVAAQVVFVLTSGGTGGQRPRFAATLAVPLVLLTVMGIVRIAKRVPVPEIAVGTAAVLVIGTANVAGLLRYRDTVAELRHGVSGTQLLAHGGLDLARYWIAQPAISACAPDGSSVATTEIGLLGVKRIHLRIIDMRGLTDRRLAHGGPDKVHKVSGINDPDWYQPTSLVGRELIRTRPALILGIDPVPAGHPILNGRYRATNPGQHAYARINGPCDHPDGSSP